MSSIRVNQQMTKFPEVAFPGTTIKSALAAMEKWNIRHLPVVADKKLVGIVSHRDLMNNAHENKIVRDVMITSIYTVTPEHPLQEVVLEMAQQKYGSAVVVNASDEIVGIFTTTDALYLLNKLLTGDRNQRFKMAQVSFCTPEYMF